MTINDLLTNTFKHVLDSLRQLCLSSLLFATPLLPALSFRLVFFPSFHLPSLSPFSPTGLYVGATQPFFFFFFVNQLNLNKLTYRRRETTALLFHFFFCCSSWDTADIFGDEKLSYQREEGKRKEYSSRELTRLRVGKYSPGTLLLHCSLAVLMDPSLVNNLLASANIPMCTKGGVKALNHGQSWKWLDVNVALLTNNIHFC